MMRTLWAGFLRSADRFADRPALFVAGKTLSYHELREAAARIAATIQSQADSSIPPLTAVFAYRSPTAFAGVLGALLAGNGYVPLNRTFPIERTRIMFQRSDCRSIIVDAGSLPQLDKLLEEASFSLFVILPDTSDIASWRHRWPKHIFRGSSELIDAGHWREPAIDPEMIAYLLFTSGSTGRPKGVMVAQRNVLAFLDTMVDRYQITERDRFSQMFDLTFDLSVFDMFLCWEKGGWLCCPSQKALINPGKFIQETALTVWFSVPSTAVFMKQLGMLKTGRYPSLRLSLFCGEPLPVSSATAWLAAAPNSILENLYGPTELTVACTLYRWDPIQSPAEAERDLVPIGYPYPGMKVLIAGEDLREVKPGREGELLMTGTQMSLGYWKDAEKTAAAFVLPPDRTEVYYRTGDRVRRPAGNGPLTYLGRNDSQVKIFGHRVELGEIEAVVRKASGRDGVVVVGWPVTPSGFGGVEAFIEDDNPNRERIRTAVAAELPDYMVPRRFHFMSRLPRNVNNKWDRAAMTQLLEGGL